jgi:putative tricarboxylic transport membrane protein
MAINRSQGLIGAGTLLGGAGLAYGATMISSEAGYGGVGPNFLPWVVSVLLMFCGGWMLWEAASGGFREMEEPSGAERGHWPGFLWVSAGILANAATITSIGFIFSCMLCFVLAVRGFKAAEDRLDLSPKAWIVDAAIGCAISAPAISLPGLTDTGWI